MHTYLAVMQGKVIRSGVLNGLCKNLPRVIWMIDFTMQDFYSIIVNTERKIFSKKRGSERVSKIIQDASSCAVNVISFGHRKHLIL